MGCAAPLEPVTLSDGRPAMGTVLEITVVAPDEATGRRWIEGCFARVDALERRLSSWDPDSDVSRLNRAARDSDPGADAETDAEWQRVDPVVALALADAKRFARQTGGAFDVTVGPLISLWRRGAADGRVPSDAELAQARSRVGAEWIAIEAGRVSLQPGMALDLGGLVKGWALDRVGVWLGDQGATRALLNFGGSSLLALGTPTDAPAWRVLVGAGKRRIGVLAISDQHASVSASLGQFYEIGGQRFGHVIDPRTGQPVSREVLAIALGASGALAEAWSTALLVRGAEGVVDATAAGLDVMVVDGAALTVSEEFPALEWLEPPAPW